MKALTCASTRRRLQAFHDRELAVRDQIAVSAHLEWCETCAASLAEMRVVRGALQALAPGRMMAREDASVFSATVLSRMKAESDASLFSVLRLMFDDMHLIYAGLGATAATVFCVLITLGMMRFATTDRPDSLAAVMDVLASPLECGSGNDLSDASGCRARWAERFARANESAELETVFALEAIVMRQGHLANLALLRATRHHTAIGDVQLIEDLMDEVSQSRLDPMLANRLPIAIRLLEQTTVRATKPPTPLDVQLPAKKRASLSGRVQPARA